MLDSNKRSRLIVVIKTAVDTDIERAIEVLIINIKEKMLIIKDVDIKARLKVKKNAKIKAEETKRDYKDIKSNSLFLIRKTISVL
jgi:hypothetical protein